MQNLIFVSLEDWDDVWRRNQFLCANLARRHPDTNILFVGLPRDVSNRVRRGKWADLRKNATWNVPNLPQITVTHPLKFLPNTFTRGRKVNEAMFRAHVRREAERLGLQSPLLWLNPHSAVHMAGRMGESAVVYDITDDWISLTQSPALTRLIAEQDAELCRKADAVIVCSQKLYDLKRDLARNLHLIPNGVDADHYASVQDGGRSCPAEAEAWPKPVLGYTGTVHPDRVDVALVERIAQGLTQGSIVLIGPNYLPASDRARLDALPNVFVKDAVPYRKLPEYMRAFDVCITPHRMTAFTESLNPIKLWEYLAAGKPIISTDVAGFRDYPQFVQIATDAPGFLKAVPEALAEAPAVSAARRAEARRHSWESRLDCVLGVVEAAGRVERNVETHV